MKSEAKPSGGNLPPAEPLLQASQGEELSRITWRLSRFSEGEHAKTIYDLGPTGRYDPMRRDVEAVLDALQASQARCRVLEEALRPFALEVSADHADLEPYRAYFHAGAIRKALSAIGGNHG